MKSLFGVVKKRYKEGGIKRIFKLLALRLKYIFWDIPVYYIYRLPKSKRDIKKFEKKKKLALEGGKYYSHRITRGFLRGISRIINFRKVKKNHNSRVLVVVHLFYMNSVDEVIEYLKNLYAYKYDLIVTYVENNYNQEALNKIKGIKSNVVFKKYRNIGYDIGPFIDVINGINLDKYDMVIKMQTKGTKRDSFAYGQFFKDRDWFRDLWNGVLGSFSVHRTINRLKNDKKCGVVAAKNLIVHDPEHKQQLVKKKMAGMNMKYVDNYLFVAGSCFAIKSVCLKKIQSMKLTQDSFDAPRNGFFSLAHVVERAVCFSALPEYDFFGNKVDFWRKMKWGRAEKKLNSINALNMIHALGDFEIDPEYAWLVLEKCFLKKAEIKKIELSRIKREHPKTGDIIPLRECEPYLYLNGGKEGKNVYENYCRYHKNNNGLPNMNIRRYEALIKNLKEKGYNPKKPIIIDVRNVICDGQHRACVLMYLFGENYRVPVLKIELIAIDPGKIRPFSNKIPLLNKNNI